MSTPDSKTRHYLCIPFTFSLPENATKQEIQIAKNAICDSITVSIGDTIIYEPIDYEELFKYFEDKMKELESS